MAILRPRRALEDLSAQPEGEAKNSQDSQETSDRCDNDLWVAGKKLPEASSVRIYWAKAPRRSYWLLEKKRFLRTVPDHVCVLTGI